MQIRLTKDEWISFARGLKEELELAGEENWTDGSAEEQLEGSVWGILNMIAVNFYAGRDTSYDFDEAQVLKFEQCQTMPYDVRNIIDYFKGCNFEEVGINYPDKTLTIYA